MGFIETVLKVSVIIKIEISCRMSGDGCNNLKRHKQGIKYLYQ